jgi:HlyD family type I secretion membrane fusion protein
MSEIVLPQPMADTAGAALSGLAGDAAVRRLIMRGASVLVGFFVLLGGWSAVAHLDSAAVAYGAVQSEGNHKVVEHPDGGIVTEILVKEGDLVQQGQVMVKLDPVQATANLNIETSAVDTFTANLARLQAEGAGASTVAYPASLTNRAADPNVAVLIKTQNEIFRTRHSAIAGNGGSLDQQIGEARALAEGYRGQVAASDKQSSMINDELAGLKKLYAQGYATKPQVLAVERSAAALEGQKKEYQANLNRLGFTVGQLNDQVGQLRRDRLSTVSEQIEDTQAKLAQAVQRQAAAQAVVDRTVIRSPVTGYIFGLAPNTIGGVIARGERIVDVLPKDAAPTVEARIKPADGAHVRAGMKVNLKIMMAGGRALPNFHGVIQTRSADLMADPKTGASYYRLTVAADRDELNRAGVSLDLGTPVEVLVPTGSRTALYYLFQPLMESFRHGLKEQ